MPSTQRNSMSLGSMALRLIMSEMRPVVPTTIWGRSFSRFRSSWALVPPMERWKVMAGGTAEACTRVYIVCAASRVGLRMIAWVRLAELSNSLTITFDIVSVFPGNP